MNQDYIATYVMILLTDTAFEVVNNAQDKLEAKERSKLIKAHIGINDL